MKLAKKQKKYKIDPSTMNLTKENFELYSEVHKECIKEAYDEKRGTICFDDAYKLIDKKLEIVNGDLRIV